ncbi:hypothetical protein ACFUVV_04165 [Streptomyces sp. NPDC057376]|uniref:hypothetical protein n=1 Tax=unclassified Streptomyces TaxID=2593676 RepID=UPI00094006C3|nr:hypothetical protein [Streptomyces sp. CB02414]OKI84116.1 hypothetical protein AMK11_22550 [Streptomyces sp. CB02414]
MFASREHGERRPERGAAGPLLGVGALVTIAGSAMYVLPGPGLPLLAMGAVLLPGVVGLWLLSRRRR